MTRKCKCGARYGNDGCEDGVRYGNDVCGGDRNLMGCGLWETNKKVVREHDFLRFSLSRERGRELFDYDSGVGAFVAPVALFTQFNIEFGVGSASASPFTDIQVTICCLHAFIATLFVAVDLVGSLSLV